MTKTIEEKIAVIEQKYKSLGPQGVNVYLRYRNIKDAKKKYSRYKKAFPIVKAEVALHQKYREIPVDIETFIKSHEYINHSEIVYPLVLKDLIELNSGKYIEAVLTGGIGTGKTFIAVVTTAYQLYVLSCLRNPQKELGLSPNDEIVFIVQSLNATQAKDVSYTRLKSLIDNSPYFTNKFDYNRNLESELQFPHRIIVRPVSGSSKAAIGSNVIGGMIDEVNFMSIIENSKSAVNGGVYNQALEVYRSIFNRRQSRFMKKGSMPGMLCLMSSKQYPGEFTDIKIEEAKTNPRIFVFDKRVWDIKDKDTFTGEWFWVFKGDEVRKPRILAKGERKKMNLQDKSLTIRIPAEFKVSFENDILSALREIAGISTRALAPYIYDIEKVASCFGRTDSVLSQDSCDFVSTNLEIDTNKFKNPKIARFIHIDLARTGDSAGIACGYVSRFVPIRRGDQNEILPEIVFDFVLEVKPPRGGEINFEKIRILLYTLRSLGLNIQWVSFDTFQSVDMIQILRSKGFKTGETSLDTSMDGYDLTKSALTDQRLLLPEHDKCYNEFISLEKDSKKGKVDHRPGGSKDCSDAVAGVVIGLTLLRKIWVEHRIPISAIPQSVAKANTGNKNSINAQEEVVT